LSRKTISTPAARRAQGEGLTVRDLVNRFLTHKRHPLGARELSPRTFQISSAPCSRILNVFGKSRLVADLAADDFGRLRAALAKTLGPIALGNDIQRPDGLPVRGCRWPD
jgi:hypothetical protein